LFELLAIFDGLGTEDGFNNDDDDVVGPVLGVLDDSVGEEEDDSDILEAVGSEEGGNTVVLNPISELGLGSGGFALVEDGSALLNQSEDFDLSSEVVGLSV